MYYIIRAYGADELAYSVQALLIYSINSGVQDMFEEKRSILEPAGALALAGAEAYCKYYGLSGENVVAITSGANMNFDKLRMVTELANVGRQQEAVLATVMPEERGSFKQFCELVRCYTSIKFFNFFSKGFGLN